MTLPVGEVSRKIDHENHSSETGLVCASTLSGHRKTSVSNVTAHASRLLDMCSSDSSIEER